ncbi:Ess2 [Scenedesmus sp. PABB004]|nr:Ess2 [Scenedesmus sp. PABB004]
MAGMMPPPPSRPGKRRVVLEEDQFAGAIEAIVERDFFPQLPKLQNQLEWLQAVQSGDPAAIKRAQLNIARRRAGLRTPLAGEPLPGGGTTGWLATPGTGLLRTPAMTPALPGGGPVMPASTPARTPAGAAAAAGLAEAGMDPVAAQAAAGARAPPLGLDQFLSAYQGEDNASFQELQARTLERKRARVAHHLVDHNAPLRLEVGGHATDEYGTSGQAPSTLVPTRHVPKNALYYDSSQQRALALSAAEEAAMVQGPPRAINHAGTRALAPTGDAPAAPGLLAGPPGGVGGGGSGDGGDGPDAGGGRPSRVAAAADAPGTSGYGYMRTPQIAPGVGASPLMTWGELAGTPLRLDGECDDIEGLAALLGEENGGSVRQFALPRVRPRELAAQRMMAGRGGSAARRGGAAGGPLGRSATPLLDSLRRRGAAGGATPLSAAGQKLAQALKGGAGAGARPGTGPRGGGRAAAAGGDAVDLQLRASYARAGTSTPARAPGSWEAATPGRDRGGSRPPSSARAQPGGAAGSGRRGAAALAAAVAAGGGGAPRQQQPAAAAAAPAAGGNLTDDLLQLG